MMVGLSTVHAVVKNQADNEFLDLKALMLEEFGHYHPDLKHIIRSVKYHCGNCHWENL